MAFTQAKSRLAGKLRLYAALEDKCAFRADSPATHKPSRDAATS